MADSEAIVGPAQRIAASRGGMVATAHPAATAAGVEMLEEGGNAMDAAVAAALALGVCEPQASGLGGQTMILYYDAQAPRTIALDGSSRAPNRATPEKFRKSRSRLLGHRATTVPSTPATLAYAASKYGKLPFARLLEPAIRLAEEGVAVSALQHRLQVREQDRGNWEKGNAGRFFLKNGTTPYLPGETVRMPELAQTMRRLASHGVEALYQGDMAAAIEQDMADNDGLIRIDDLANIPWPIERRPVSCRFEGYRLHTFPPPAAGRTLVEMLNILSHFKEKNRNPDGPYGAALLCEVVRRAQIDRQDRPFDPNYYAQVENKRMTSGEYARLVARQIKSRLKTPKAAKPLGPTDGRGEAIDNGHGETTHLSAMDRAGNVAGLTQSVERVYGSFAVHPELGILYNNYMSAFEYEDVTHPYYLRPNGPPWASVAPTIVFRGRRPFLVLGSPGSERITSAILQVFLRMNTHSPLMAVTAPRLHCSAAGVVHLEGAWMRDDIPDDLRRRGFTVEVIEPFSFYLGCVQLVLRRGDTYLGVADPRRDGTAGGPRC